MNMLQVYEIKKTNTGFGPEEGEERSSVCSCIAGGKVPMLFPFSSVSLSFGLFTLELGEF